MKSKAGVFEIAIVAPPWWLIPSDNIITATEHLVEDYSFNFNKFGYKSIIFSRKKDYTDKNGVKDINKYNNRYVYTRVSQIDRKFFNKTNTLFFYLIYILRVALKVRRLKIKKVIVFQTFSFCYWIKFLNPETEVNYYTVNHELSRSDNYYQYGFIPNKLAIKVFPKIHSIITMSEYIKKGIVNRFPEVKDQCKVVYVGIDTDIFKRSFSKKKEKIITYSGRVVPEKGVHLLSKAFKNLQTEFKDIKLYIIGGGIGPNVPRDYFDNFKHNGIKMFGLLTRKDVANILRESSIFVYPVIWEEPFGLAPIEAMAVGLPTVVSNTKAGYTEIINESNGYYFKNNDEKDLERVLRYLLSPGNNSEEVCKNAINTVQERLSWEKCIENTIKTFSIS